MKFSLLRPMLALLVSAAFCGSSGAQNAADGFNPDVNGTVRAIAFAADGSCLIGGDFTTVGGVSRSRLARLLPDGSVDAVFNPGANASVSAIAVQEDGRIIAAGQFTTAGGRSRTGLVRLNADGTVDESFSPAAVGGAVLALAVQPDGRILAGGQFTSLAGLARPALGRLNSDGSPDPGFDAELNGSVRSLALLRDGSIAAGGTFTISGGIAANGLIRLRQDGFTVLRYPTAAGTQVNSVAAWPDGSIAASIATGSVNQVGIYPLGSASQMLAVSGPVYSLAVQGDGMVVAGGNFSTAGGQPRNNVFRFTRTGALNALSTAAANEVLCIAIQQDGKIMAGGNFTTFGTISRNRMARMYADGKMDTSFNPGSNAFELGGNGGVSLVAQQPNGLLLAGGYQHTLAAQIRIGLGRLYMDGTLDAPFNPNAGTIIEDPTTDCAIVQEDGKIVVGGQFSQLGGLSRQKIARINPDGTGDPSLSADISMTGTWSRVSSLAVQKDGKILVGGRFNLIGGVARSFIARLNVNGTVDTTFNPMANEMVETITVQEDGKILVGGSFSSLGGVPRAFIGRLNADGTLDTGFNPGSDSAVYSIALQSDGKILVGGYFNRLGGASKYRLGRLNSNGTLDTTFDVPPGGEYPRIFSIAVQANGMIIVSGTFTSLKGTARNQIGRLFPDGTLDTTWNPNGGSSGFVPTVGLMDDGKCIAGGNYSNIGGQARRNIARLSNRYAALQKLELNSAGTSVRWLRGGGAPEASQTIFDVSEDGVNFTRLGFGGRFTGGWQLNDVALPAGGSFLLRARARIPGGTQNGSTGLIETLRLVHREPEINVQAGGKDYYSLQATSLDFGTSRTGNPVDRSVTLTNSGNAPLNVSGHVLAPGYELLDFPASPFTLAGGESRVFQLRLSATVPGSFAGHLTLQSNDGDESAFALPLSGTVVAPEIAVYEGTGATPPDIKDGTPVAIAFGAARQGTALSRLFTIANHGSAPLILRGLTAPTGFAWIDLPIFPIQLELGETVTFRLSLTAEEPGEFTGPVSVDNDDDDENPFNFTVNGTVITPEIAVHAGPTTGAAELTSGQTGPLPFDRVVQASPGIRSLFIANGGTAPLRVESVSVPSGYEAVGLPEMPFLIPPGNGTTFEIRLTSLVPGIYTGSATIRSDDLDEAAFTFPVSGEIFIPEPVAAVVNTSTQLNRQTGLRQQTLKLSNPTTATVPAYLILIRGLPPGVVVYNASSVREDGTAVITILQALQPFSELDIIIEYYSANRLPADVSPQITTEVILAPPTYEPGQGPSFEIDRILSLPAGEMLLEFTSQPGRLYAIEYCSNGKAWSSSPLRIRAAGNRVQWIDRGPPQTDSPPSTQPSRFYRVREISP